MNPLRFYDNLVTKVNESKPSIDAGIAKQSKLVDFYKLENKELREKLEATEIELDMHRSIREIFAVKVSDSDAQKEISRLKTEACRQQDHLDVVTKNYEKHISSL